MDNRQKEIFVRSLTEEQKQLIRLHMSDRYPAQVLREVEELESDMERARRERKGGGDANP